MLADFSHLGSIFILLHKMVQLNVCIRAFPSFLAHCRLTTSKQSCSGISFKSQALYLMVYVTRYLGMSPLASLTPID